MAEKHTYRVEPIPPIRRFSLDAGYLGRRRHIVHGLIEVDVTNARNLIRAHENETGTKLSFTAFVISCLCSAMENHPHVHAYRDWRNRLVIYEDINVTCMFEVEFDGRKTPIAHIFRGANRKSLWQLHNELRELQANPHRGAESRFMRWFVMLPAVLRRGFYWIVMRVPQSFRNNSSSVMVTAIGMFGGGGGWAITMPNFTLNVALGGISRKPGVHQDEIRIRDFLDLTVSFDHDVVDGAPAARFVQSFRTLLEEAYGLADLADSAR